MQNSPTDANSEDVPAPTVKSCRHCGSVFRAEANEDFCSAACRVVHERILAAGLESFYTFAKGSVQPADSRIFHPEDMSWLNQAQANAEATAEKQGGAPELECGIEGISCLGCVWLVEELFKREPGALECTISPARGRLRLCWRTGKGLKLAAFARVLQNFGYCIFPREHASDRRLMTNGISSLSKRLGVCAALAMNTMLFTLPHYLGMPADDPLAKVMDPLTFALATASMIFGGSYFIDRAIAGLRANVASIDLPIAIGLIVAWSGSTISWGIGRRDLLYFDFVAMFTFLMLAGRWMQEHAARAARRTLERGDFKPGPLLYRDNAVSDNSTGLAALKVGAVYGVPPGGTVPVRSLVHETPVELRLDWISGEPNPRVFPVGALVPSGAGVIGTSPAWFQALEEWKDSRLASLLSAQPDFAERPGLGARRVVRFALATVLVLAFSAALYHMTLRSISDALQVFVSVLVVSCPCAIGVAIPLCDEIAAATARKRGVIIRDPTIWSRIAEVRTVCFDKTGTLTSDTPELVNRDALDALSASERETLLSMAWRSLHPAACALREALIAKGTVADEAADDATEYPGLGIEWRDQEGKLWRVGRAGWSGPKEAGGGTIFSCDNQVLGRFEFAETPRPETSVTIRELTIRGLSVVLLSGDDPPKVSQFAQKHGITTAFGGLSPEGKAAWIRRQGREFVLMIGDGGNDNLAFKEAACRGTPANERGLLERNADFYLAGDRVGGVARLFGIADKRRTRIRRLAIFTVTYNLCVLIPAMAGAMNPLLAAVLMPLSSLSALAIAASRFAEK